MAVAQLVVVTGPPCSGKSTLARALGVAPGTVVLDIDEVREAVIPDSNQSLEDRNVAYRCMHLVADKLLKAGLSRVVVVGTYGRRQPRQWLCSIADRMAGHVCVTACRVSPETAVTRFRSRQAGHPAVDLTDDRVRRQAMDYQYGAARIVDCETVVEDSVAQAEGYVRAGERVRLTEWASQGQGSST